METDMQYIPYGDGTYIILPKLTKFMRSIEDDISKFLEDHLCAEEIILPKIINVGDVDRLYRIHDRFHYELRAEQFTVCAHDHVIGYLAHWQCEPVYFYLEEIFKDLAEDSAKIVFDRSSPSYRNEGESGVLNFHEFKRIEVVFCGNEKNIRYELEKLKSFMLSYTNELSPGLVNRPEESFSGKEEVADIVVNFDNKNIEIFGSHIHFKTFIDGLGARINKNAITACCGISISRIAFIKYANTFCV